jgi:uracil-DNA glycosylase
VTGRKKEAIDKEIYRINNRVIVCLGKIACNGKCGTNQTYI